MITKTAILIAITIFCATFEVRLAHNDPNSDKDGAKALNSLKSKLGIINSNQDAGRKEFPWQCSMRSNGFHFCGCSILNKRWLITAAHCVENKVPDNVEVVFNAWNVSKIETYSLAVNVSKIIINPQYIFNLTYLHNDIALLKMNRDLFLQSNRAIFLPEQQSEPMDKFAGKWSTIIGRGLATWKDIDNFTSQSWQNSKMVNLTILKQQICVEAYANWQLHVGDDMICAANYEKGVCGGDTGGPLVTFEKGKWTLQGITSWGLYCSKPYNPTVFTRVSKFVDWIKATVKDN